MSEIGEEIICVAAKGDGITASGRFAANAAPGDRLLADGRVVAGVHHAVPVCRHYARCGGCQLQHLDEQTLAEFVTDRVTHAAKGQGLVAERVFAPHLSPPASRRRASLRAETLAGRIALGYREAGSHKIVDLAECPVLKPELADLIGPLRKMLARQKERIAVDIDLAWTDQGPDLALKGLKVEGLEATEAVLDFARDNRLARLGLDQGYGPEAVWEPEPVTVTLGGVAVGFPSGAFLQATADGEAVLAAALVEWFSGAKAVADLFSGLGTFGFGLARRGIKILAVEADQAAFIACKSAAGRGQLPVHAMHRDLFRNPLMADELNRFDGVVLDPPRAGAREQVLRLADSTAARVAYISCNPASWAKDAAVLVAGGYRLVDLRPVGQFRWSTHVELASLFVRG
ncbi:MAG: rRNA ((1939)-C(5))-methyltransferase RlmD [Pseudomonadota bacterium]